MNVNSPAHVFDMTDLQHASGAGASFCRPGKSLHFHDEGRRGAPSAGDGFLLTGGGLAADRAHTASSPEVAQ
jgi:hypothetical protein